MIEFTRQSARSLPRSIHAGHAVEDADRAALIDALLAITGEDLPGDELRERAGRLSRNDRAVDRLASMLKQREAPLSFSRVPIEQDDSGAAPALQRDTREEMSSTAIAEFLEAEAEACPN